MGDCERQLTKVDAVRNILDLMIMSIEDPLTQRDAYVHLYGTGQACAMIALKRGHDGKYAELACIAGMLHDFSKYEKNDLSDDHGKHSAIRD